MKLKRTTMSTVSYMLSTIPSSSTMGTALIPRSEKMCTTSKTLVFIVAVESGKKRSETPIDEDVFASARSCSKVSRAGEGDMGNSGRLAVVGVSAPESSCGRSGFDWPSVTIRGSPVGSDCSWELVRDRDEEVDAGSSGKESGPDRTDSGDFVSDSGEVGDIGSGELDCGCDALD